jgi:hypothetical protein
MSDLDAGRGKNQQDEPSRWRVFLYTFGAAILVLVAAFALWKSGDDEAKGAAITLTTFAAHHLIREAGQLLQPRR